MKKIELKFPTNISIDFRKVIVDLSQPTENLISIDSTDYIPYYLDNTKPGNPGGNSYILKLLKAQEFEEEDQYPLIPDLIIKICKFELSKFKEEHHRSQRFKIEIDALVECNNLTLPNIINVHHYGVAEISNKKGKIKSFRYYTMDYADSDLSNFLKNNNINFLQRVELALEICESLKLIWKNDFYHRDIKPDNILYVGSQWAISDLGLALKRNVNNIIDDDGEWIGPRGWMSPESMNKFLAETKPWGELFDCNIDHQSDIYQLGKVLWYIFQGNSPEGGLRRSDFLWNNDRIYQVLRTMLNNSKNKRYLEIEDVILILNKERKDLEKNKVSQEKLYN